MMKIFLYLMIYILIQFFFIKWWEMVMYMIFLLMLIMVTMPFMEFLMVYNNLVIDFLSFSLVMLSIWISIIMIMASWMIKKNNFFMNYFMSLVLILLLVLMICFFSNNLLMFYFFFEISLIPTLLIIMGWGFQLERIQAGIYFLFYTLTASLPLLLNLVLLHKKMGGFGSLVWMSENEILFIFKKLILFLMLLTMIMAFLVKLPMFFVHLWLPKAHVEAPVAGSMILAGVLLKLGGYGIYRILPFLVEGIFMFSMIFMSLGLMSMIYVGFMCWRLNDLKALVAYSSVAHMGLVMCGLFSLFIYGINGSLIMMISHGLSSSGLFCMVNMFYERVSSRSLFFIKGMLMILPALSFMFFILCAANISAPPTINLLGEIFLMMSILSYNKFMMMVFPLGSFLGAVFTLFFFSYSQHGKSSVLSVNFMNTKINEFHSIMLHIIPLNVLILKSELFFS